MGALIGIGALIYKNTSEGGAYLEGCAYWKEGAKSNHYGTHYSFFREEKTSLLFFPTSLYLEMVW